MRSSSNQLIYRFRIVLAKEYRHVKKQGIIYRFRIVLAKEYRHVKKQGIIYRFRIVLAKEYRYGKKTGNNLPISNYFGKRIPIW